MTPRPFLFLGGTLVVLAAAGLVVAGWFGADIGLGAHPSQTAAGIGIAGMGISLAAMPRGLAGRRARPPAV